MPHKLITEKIETLNRRVREAAMADGVISHDEAFIMAKTQISIENLHKYIQSKPSSDLARQKIAVLINIIENDALDAAELDEYISEDEMGILHALFNALDEITSSTSNIK
jgi:hypothetical protein